MVRMMMKTRMTMLMIMMREDEDDGDDGDWPMEQTTKTTLIYWCNKIQNEAVIKW